MEHLIKINIVRIHTSLRTHFLWHRKCHRCAQPIRNTVNSCLYQQLATFPLPYDYGHCHRWPYYMMPSMVMPKRCEQRLGSDKPYPSAFWCRFRQSNEIEKFVPSSSSPWVFLMLTLCASSHSREFKRFSTKTITAFNFSVQKMFLVSRNVFATIIMKMSKLNRLPHKTEKRNLYVCVCVCYDGSVKMQCSCGRMSCAMPMFGLHIHCPCRKSKTIFFTLAINNAIFFIHSSVAVLTRWLPNENIKYV